MNKNMGIFALALFSVILMTSFVFAQGFDGQFNQLTDDEKSERKAEMETIRTAIENNDYSTWKDLMEAQLTQDNFDKLVEHHEKRSEARNLMDELKEARKNDDQTRVDELKEELQDLRPSRDEDSQNGQRGRSNENRHRGFFQRLGGFLGR